MNSKAQLIMLAEEIAEAFCAGVEYNINLMELGDYESHRSRIVQNSDDFDMSDFMNYKCELNTLGKYLDKLIMQFIDMTIKLEMEK